MKKLNIKLLCYFLVQFLITEVFSQVAAPLTVSATASRCGGINVAFIALPEASNISIYYRIKGSAIEKVKTIPYPTNIPRFNTFGDFLNVQAGTYEIRVQQVIAGVAGDTSERVSITQIINPRQVPTGVRIDSVAISTAILKWNAMPAAESYELIVTQTNPLPRNAHLASMRLYGENSFASVRNQTRYKLELLEPAGTYNYKIRYVSDGCLSELSSSQTFVTHGLLPSVTKLRLDSSSLTATSARIVWDRVPEATSYKIAWQDPMIINVQSQIITETSYDIRGLLAGNKYNVSVNPLYKDELGMTSSNLLLQTNSIINIPREIQVTNSYDTSATISWKIVSPDNEIYYRKKGDAVFTKIRPVSSPYSLNKLTKGTEYEFKIRNIVFSEKGYYLTSEFSTLMNFTAKRVGFGIPGGSNPDTRVIDLVSDGFQGKLSVVQQSCETTNLLVATSNKRATDSVLLQLAMPTNQNKTVFAEVTWPSIRWGVKNNGPAFTPSFNCELRNSETNELLQTVTVNGMAANQNIVFFYQRPKTTKRLARKLCNPAIVFMDTRSAPNLNQSTQELWARTNWADPARFKVIIDAKNEIPETNESNNTIEY